MSAGLDKLKKLVLPSQVIPPSVVPPPIVRPSVLPSNVPPSIIQHVWTFGGDRASSTINEMFGSDDRIKAHHTG
ncbi:hypothetical protein PGT21_032581 [Puccinia graminis f. sp. tritici]|uniref:Uncharacterized protein n=1 Tax=Puccinia graminis f. sp. tritici TaxID=56615 RepID=A0A5B0MIZ7_PUCGR|nr:hypothetical protein PGTUg99_033818 [Puccinia graminis f. sp. tritici]KAA1091390.1 hypothetical protein PGT21_032581 [Puccinia graminis f. sp. tritici]